jgi:hypothetical protein
MRVFVLSTGRTGSSTLAAAFSHATNFTAAHESRIEIARGRLDYPDQHIEADNRLTWFTGSLTRQYPDAFIVHLTRSEDEVVASFRRRFRDTWTTSGRLRSDLSRAVRRDSRLSIIDGFAHSILHRSNPWPAAEVDDVIRLYRTTVDDNVELLLRHHDHARIDLATAPEDFRMAWERIGITGDLDAALNELTIRHNASGS